MPRRPRIIRVRSIFIVRCGVVSRQRRRVLLILAVFTPGARLVAVASGPLAPIHVQVGCQEGEADEIKDEHAAAWAQH